MGGRVSTLLSSVAESLYWAGRYLERAEDMSRIILVHGDTHVDLPVGEDVGWEPLLAIAGVEGPFETHFGTPNTSTPSGHAGPREVDVVEFLLVHEDNPSSILRAVANARDCLRLSRPAITTDAWERCNHMWLALDELRDTLPTRFGRTAWLRQVMSDCHRLSGTLWGTMRRDGGEAFVRIGQFLERADLVCRVLAVRADAVAGHRTENAYEQIRAISLLRSLAAYEGFQRMSAARERQPSLLDLLLLDEAHPRSVAACLSEIRGQVKDLPNNEPVLSACSDASVHLAASPSSAARSVPELRAYLGEFQPLLATIHCSVQATYFHGATMPRRIERLPVRRAPARSSSIDRRVGARTYRVTHRTVYHYGSTAERSYNEAHLRPRDTARQHCESHELRVVPAPHDSVERTDLLGNHVTRFAVEGTFDTLSVTAQSRVLVVPPPAPPRSMPWESAVTALERDRRPEARQARRFRAESRLVHSSDLIAEYARASFVPNRPFVDAVTDLCSRIHNDFTYEPGFTSVGTPMLDAFEARKGVCQDFTHVAIACLRAVRLAARYVSGYLETTPPPGRERLVGVDSSHAWVAAYLPGWGWIDIDPTNDQLVSERYVTVAWGRDYWDVSPLRGIVEGGGSSHELEVAVDVELLSSTTQPAEPASA